MKAVFWLVTLTLSLVPAGGSATTVQFGAPAGNTPVQHLRGSTYDAVLPSGRIVTPAGRSAVSGMNALGVALSPDGRFAIVSNDDERASGVRSAVDPNALGGYSLAVIDTTTMQIADRFSVPGDTYFAGIAVVADVAFPGRTLVFAAGGPSNTVSVLDLDASGHLTPDAQHVIPIPGPIEGAFADAGQSFPGTLVAAPDGRRVYVVNHDGDSVTAIDTATRAPSGTSRPVGFFPFGAALAGDRLLVTNEGLMRYARLADALLAPPFLTPAADPLRASSLSLIDLVHSGDFTPETAAPAESRALALDVPTDGRRVVGGAHPTAIAVTADAAYAFIAMTNVDRIATVRLGGSPVVVGGTELRLFDRGPYGTQPAALALSHDGTRLYVALAGLNAVAVLDARDPVHLHRLGLIPTGWFPSALALAPDDRTLYVLNTKGFGHDNGFTGDPVTGADSTAVWSTLEQLDVGHVNLSHTTVTTLQNTRVTRSIAPQYPPALRNVVVIVAGNQTFDALLGDAGYAPADASYLRFGAAITPNLHLLARRYGVAGNIFADGEDVAVAHQFALGGFATTYVARTSRVTGASPADASDNPEDYPRSGYIYHNLARHHLSFRDYGDGLRVAGYDDGEATAPTSDDPAFAGIDDRRAPTQGLGGRYRFNVPAPAILAGHVDLNYPGWNVRIRDERRAREFISDYAQFVSAHRLPRYTHIWLPGDPADAESGSPPVAEQVGDGDRALGAIVQYLSHLDSWRHTVIFVMPDAAVRSRDHVDESRTYAIVISPFAKRRYVGMRHLSTASVLKTSEQILRLPPLSLGDLLASDMSDFFTARADLRPFAAVQSPAGRP